MKFRGKGCSREMADRIVDLLLSDCGIPPDSDYRNPEPKPAPAPPEPIRRRKPRKLTDAVVRYIQEHRDKQMPALLAAVQETFGISLSEVSIYRAWKREV